MHAKHLTMVCDAKKTHLGVIHLFHISTMSTLCYLLRQCLIRMLHFSEASSLTCPPRGLFKEKVKTLNRKQNLSETQNIKKKKAFWNPKYKTRSLSQFYLSKKIFSEPLCLWRDMIFIYQLVISNTFSPKEINYAKWARSPDKGFPRSASWRREKKYGVIKKIVAEKWRGVGGGDWKIRNDGSEQALNQLPTTADWESSETSTEFSNVLLDQPSTQLSFPGERTCMVWKIKKKKITRVRPAYILLTVVLIIHWANPASH